MIDLPLVSVIIPLFNKENTIGDCIESILSQSYQNYEVIIIDDGSNDQSKEVVYKYCELSTKIKYYYQENYGVSNARNKGIELSKGYFILFVDADDVISPSFIQNFISHYNIDDDIVICGLTKVFADKSTIEVNVPKIGVFSKEQIFKDFLTIQKNNGFYGFVCSKLIKTEILREHKILFDEAIKLGEDLDFFINYYSYCNRFQLIDGKGYHYTQDLNLSSKNNVDYVQLILIYLKLEKMLEKSGCLNKLNRSILNSTFSDWKYAYFNEMEFITKATIKKGLNVLRTIKLIKKDRLSDSIVKWLVENEVAYLLKVYLKVRLSYMNYKRKK